MSDPYQEVANRVRILAEDLNRNIAQAEGLGLDITVEVAQLETRNGVNNRVKVRVLRVLQELK